MKLTAMNRNLILSASLVLGSLNNASATVISGSADGYAAYSDLSAFNGALTLSVGPTPTGVSINAPAPGSASNSVLNLNAQGSSSTLGELKLNTGLLSANASSDVDGLAGARTSSADASAHDISFEVIVQDLLQSVLRIDMSATTLRSDANVSGDYGSFSASGSSYFENFSMSVDGTLAASLHGSAAANTVLFNSLGLTVIANEQIENCLVSFCELEVNALHFLFNDFAMGSGVLNGDLILSHSYAMLESPAAVPVPAALPLMLSGLGLLVAAGRKRQAVK